MILLIVLATATPNPNAAMKLKNAANPTACLGLRTFVETTVAIAFAESWKPFVKSKTNARKMIMTTRINRSISVHPRCISPGYLQSHQLHLHIDRLQLLNDHRVL